MESRRGTRKRGVCMQKDWPIIRQQACLRLDPRHETDRSFIHSPFLPFPFSFFVFFLFIFYIRSRQAHFNYNYVRYIICKCPKFQTLFFFQTFSTRKLFRSPKGNIIQISLNVYVYYRVHFCIF